MNSTDLLLELEERHQYILDNPVSSGKKVTRMHSTALLTAATALVEIRQDLRRALDLEDEDEQ